MPDDEPENDGVKSQFVVENAIQNNDGPARKNSFAIGNTPLAGFKPGASGNPAGRPKAEREVVNAARTYGVESIKVLQEIMLDKKAMTLARVRSAEILLERGFGKAVQRVVVEGDVAGLSNPALAAFVREKLAEANRTVEGRLVESNGPLLADDRSDSEGSGDGS